MHYFWTAMISHLAWLHEILCPAATGTNTRPQSRHLIRPLAHVAGAMRTRATFSLGVWGSLVQPFSPFKISINQSANI